MTQPDKLMGYRRDFEPQPLYFMNKDGLHEYDGVMAKPCYEHFPKDYTVTYTRWQLLKARLFGMRISEPQINAYLYKGKWYITRIGRGV